MTTSTKINPGMKEVVIRFHGCDCEVRRVVPESRPDDTRAICAEHKHKWKSITDHFPDTRGQIDAADAATRARSDAPRSSPPSDPYGSFG